MGRVKTDRYLEFSLIALVLALVWVVSDTIHERVVVVGDSAPSFSVTTKTGKTIGPRNFEGQLLMVNFWATWCPPCIEETPALNALHQRFGSRGLTILGISVDQNEKAYDDFVERFRIGYQVARDPDADISSGFGTYKYPETYIIDRNGKVLEKIIGADWNLEQLSKRLEAMLG